MISPKASLCRSIPSIFLCLRFTSIVYLAAAPNLNSAFDESISVETQGWARFFIFGNRSILVSFRASCSLTSSSAARPFYTSSGFSKSLHGGLGSILIRTGSAICTGVSDMRQVLSRPFPMVAHGFMARSDFLQYLAYHRPI